MGQVCNWFLTKRIEPIYSAPPQWWRIVIAGISALTDIINPTFVTLQSPSLLLSVQLTLLDELTAEISTLIGIREPLSNEELQKGWSIYYQVCKEVYKI